MTEKVNSLIVTPEVRFLFPNLFEKKQVLRNGKPVGKPIFSLAMLFTPGTEKELTQLLLRVAKAKWPNRDVVADIKNGTIKWPFQDGAKAKAAAEAKGKKGDFYDNTKVLKAGTEFDVGMVGPNKQEIINPKDIYSGCYGYVELNAYAYDGVDGGKDGLKFYLNNVMKSRDGDRLIGRSVQDAFSGVQAQETSEDLSAGGDFDDEITF